VYAAEELFSFGLATPLVVEQVTTLVASWAAKIARWLRGLLGSLRELMRVVPRLDDLIAQLRTILDRLRGKPPAPSRSGASPKAGDLIRQGKEFQGRKLPNRGGPPNEVMYKRDSRTGEVTNYTLYDAEGYAVKRVDLTGRDHAGIPTPHVVLYEKHVNPQTGEVFVREQRHVRPAFPEEIP
jgi:hypothetical protein